MKVLAVDPGAKRTGFAVSDPDETMALSLPTLRDADAADVARVAREQEASTIVVGLPLNMDGSKGPAAERTLEWVEELRLHTDIPIVTWDERLSSAEGEERLRDAGLDRRERAQRSDAAAAIVILESYLRRSR